jgi:formylglycine-generating enzyme required for sulfatase activity
LRGGSWYYNVPGYFRGAARFNLNPERRNYLYGFRLARTVTL